MKSCDCLNFCGDDPDIKKGNVDPCSSEKERLKKKSAICPFCGGQPKYRVHTKNFDGSLLTSVACSGCGASVVGKDDESWTKWFKRVKSN